MTVRPMAAMGDRQHGLSAMEIAQLVDADRRTLCSALNDPRRMSAKTSGDPVTVMRICGDQITETDTQPAWVPT